MNTEHTNIYENPLILVSQHAATNGTKMARLGEDNCINCMKKVVCVNGPLQINHYPYLNITNILVISLQIRFNEQIRPVPRTSLIWWDLELFDQLSILEYLSCPVRRKRKKLKITWKRCARNERGFQLAGWHIRLYFSCLPYCILNYFLKKSRCYCASVCPTNH